MSDITMCYGEDCGKQMKPQIIMNSLTGNIQLWTKTKQPNPYSKKPKYIDYYDIEYPCYRANWHTFEIDFVGVNKSGTNMHWTRYNPYFISIGDL